MELVWKCAVLGVAVSLLGLLLRRSGEEKTLLLGMAASVMICLACLRSLEEAEALFSGLWTRSGLAPSLLLPVIKSLGLALLGRFSAGFCRDSGQSTAAQAVELASVCAILCVSLPLLRSLADVVFAYT